MEKHICTRLLVMIEGKTISKESVLLEYVQDCCSNDLKDNKLNKEK